jgi:hypothetical protein
LKKQKLEYCYITILHTQPTCSNKATSLSLSPSPYRIVLVSMPKTKIKTSTCPQCGSKSHGISHCPKTATIVVAVDNATLDSLSHFRKEDLKFAYGHYKKVAAELRVDISDIVLPKTNIAYSATGKESSSNKKFSKWTKDDLLATCVALYSCIKEHKRSENECPICRECLEDRNCTTPPCGHTVCTDCMVKIYRHCRGSYYSRPACSICRADLFIL